PKRPMWKYTVLPSGAPDGAGTTRSASGGSWLRAALSDPAEGRLGALGRDLPFGHALAKPLHRPQQALFEAYLRLEAHERTRTRDIQAARGLPVGFRGVPRELALIAGEPSDHVGESPNPGLDAGAHIHRVRGLQVLARQEQRARGVVNVEELAGRIAAAPHGHLRSVGDSGFVQLANHRRNHMGVLQRE